MNKAIRHSILMVCYNQEDYISESIESAINQTTKAFEIVVLDDCSKDNTWEIVKKYALRYPDLIKAHRNESNLGIFKNMRKVRQFSTGNVINFLSGDDLYKPKTLENVDKGIVENGLDPDSDKFIIVLNSLHLYPDGKETIWDNYSERFKDPVKLRLRYGLSYRGVGMSNKLIESVPTEDEILEKFPSLAYSSDWVKGFEEVIAAESIVFVDYAGPVYRLGSGITTKKIKMIEASKSHINIVNHIRLHYRKYWDIKDLKYINGLIASEEYFIKPSIKSFSKAFYYWIINVNNFSSNFPWIRSFKAFLPKKSITLFKYKVYPFYQKLRGRKH